MLIKYKFGLGGVKLNLELVEWFSTNFFFLPPLDILTEFRKRGVLYMIK